MHILRHAKKDRIRYYIDEETQVLQRIAKAMRTDRVHETMKRLRNFERQIGGRGFVVDYTSGAVRGVQLWCAGHWYFIEDYQREVQPMKTGREIMAMDWYSR